MLLRQTILRQPVYDKKRFLWTRGFWGFSIEWQGAFEAAKPLSSWRLESKEDRARGRDQAQSRCVQVKSPGTYFLSLGPTLRFLSPPQPLNGRTFRTPTGRALLIIRDCVVGHKGRGCSYFTGNMHGLCRHACKHVLHIDAVQLLQITHACKHVLRIDAVQLLHITHACKHMLHIDAVQLLHITHTCKHVLCINSVQLLHITHAVRPWVASWSWNRCLLRILVTY